MSKTVIIKEEKLSDIIEFSNDEIAKKNDGVTKDTIVSHIVNKMMEDLKDDIIED